MNITDPLTPEEINALRSKYPTRDALIEALIGRLLDQGMTLLQAGLLVGITCANVVNVVHPKEKLN